MLVGLLHMHKGLAYLVFLVALLNAVLVLSNSQPEPRVARVIQVGTRFGVAMGGRIVVLLGLVLWMMLPQHGLGTWWAWASLVGWAPVEILSKRMVAPQLERVLEGKKIQQKLLWGVLGQLVLVAAIFAVMSIGPR